VQCDNTHMIQRGVATCTWPKETASTKSFCFTADIPLPLHDNILCQVVTHYKQNPTKVCTTQTNIHWNIWRRDLSHHNGNDRGRSQQLISDWIVFQNAHSSSCSVLAEMSNSAASFWVGIRHGSDQTRIGVLHGHYVVESFGAWLFLLLLACLLVGLPEKYTGLDDVAKPLYPNVYVFPFLPQVAFARKFMVIVHRVFPTRS